MDCEMSPMLQQQQELMSQSPSETTQAARNSDSAARVEGEGSIPGYLWCVREAISVSLIVVKLFVWSWQNCGCLLKWIWPHFTGFPFFQDVAQDPEFSVTQFWHLLFRSFWLQNRVLSVADLMLVGYWQVKTLELAILVRWVDSPSPGWNLTAHIPS